MGVSNEVCVAVNAYFCAHALVFAVSAGSLGVCGSVSGGAGGVGKFHRTRRSSSALCNEHIMKTRGHVSVYDLISHCCFGTLNSLLHGALV